MRTLDESINHYEWCAKEAWGECSDEARQMADWLIELKKLRGLERRERTELVGLLNDLHKSYIDMVNRYESAELSLIWDQCSDPDSAEDLLADECDGLRNKYADRVNKANESLGWCVETPEGYGTREGD